MLQALIRHWPEYLIEASGLAVAMMSACAFAVVLLHVDSPVVQVIDRPVVRRVLLGLAAGSTAIALGYSPWGKQSGAHFNPSVTLTFFTLGRVPFADAIWYVCSQLVGGLVGMQLMNELLGTWLASPSIHSITTMPTSLGPIVTWVTEFSVTFLLMAVILVVSNSAWRRWTSVFVGLIIATNVSSLAPIFGTSLNPWRTVSAASIAHAWQAVWIYLTAGPLGMLAAAKCYIWLFGVNSVFCAKLHHDNPRRCIFCEARRSLTS